MKIQCITLFIILSLTLPLLSQDTHYWTQQFGTRSSLMGGAVVAGSDDNSTVVYNPGALGFITNPSISVNANIYRNENIRIKNALGQEADFKTSNFGSIPSLIAGMVNLKNSDLKLGYGIMSPVNFSFKGTARLDGNFELVDDQVSPGEELFAGELNKYSQVSEFLGAVGFGYKISDQVSIGISNLFTLRTVNYNQLLLSHLILNDTVETVVQASIFQQVSYFHARYAARFGLSYQSSQWSLGMTLTTPSVGILGRGSLAGDLNVQNIMVEDGRVTGFASDRQDKLKTTFKAPFSIATGVEYRRNKSVFAFSAQYFAGIGLYDIIRAEPNTIFQPADIYGDLGGSEDFLRVREAAKPVFNVALAYEYLWKDDLHLNFSVRNDMSYYDSQIADLPSIKPDLTTWNIYHFTIGTTLFRERSSMSLGLVFSTGKTDSYRENNNLDNIDEENVHLGSTTITEAFYFSPGILLGYAFNFRKFQ